MPSKIFTSASPFVKAVVAEYRYAMERRLPTPPNANPGGVRAFLLDPEQVATFVTELFWASFDLEEGRPVKCEIVVLGENANVPALKFSEPRAMSRKALVSLATASPRNAIALGVSDNLTLSFWGLLNVIPYGPLIRFRIAGPGIIVAARGNRTIAISSKTNELSVDPTSDYLGGVADFLEPIIYGSERQTSQREKRKLISMVYLILAIQRHGHGGTLAIVPDNVNIETLPITMGFRLTSDILLKPLNDLEQFESEQQHLLEEIGAIGRFDIAERLPSVLVAAQQHLEQELSSICNRIGRLSAVDGALLITHELRVLGFGCMFKPRNTENSDSIIIEEEDLARTTLGFEKKRQDEIGGMRHRSAAQFVFDQPDSTVIVASQDGGLAGLISMMDGNSPKVAIIRNLQHMLWDTELTIPIVTSE